MRIHQVSVLLSLLFSSIVGMEVDKHDSSACGLEIDLCRTSPSCLEHLECILQEGKLYSKSCDEKVRITPYIESA